MREGREHHPLRGEKQVKSYQVNGSAEAHDLAEKLTARLFDLGSNGVDDPCGRMQFMLGRYGVNERPGGGLNREAFKRFVTRVIDECQDQANGTLQTSMTQQADAHLRALLRYTEGFYSTAIEHGMKAGTTANAIAHVESAGKAMHQIIHAQAAMLADAPAAQARMPSPEDLQAQLNQQFNAGREFEAARLAAISAEKGATKAPAAKDEAELPEDVKRVLDDALLALSFCGKSSQARALNAQAIRSIKQLLGQS